MVKVWDLFVRWSHWLIVLLVISAWLSSEFGDSEYKWHSLNGYAIFVLVLTRIIWGFVGSTTARFSHFLKSPKKSFKYLLALRSDKTPESLGHNPTGGWMVVVLLVVLLAQATTGMFTSDDISFEGPFAYYVSTAMSEKLTGLHHLLFNGLLVLIVLHVAAVLYHQLIKKESIIKAMITGEKISLPLHKHESSALIFRSVFFALTILMIVGATLWWLLKEYA